MTTLGAVPYSRIMGLFVRVKLGDGRRVRDPATGHILIAGKEYRVRSGQFWFRRIDAGDVVLCDESSAPKVEELKLEKPKLKKKEKSGE